MKGLLLLCFAFSGVFASILPANFPLKPCLLNSTCSCNNVDGFYDLHPLASNNNTPRFTGVNEQGTNYVYSYNPCTGFDEGGGSCKDAAICQIVQGSNLYIPIGTASSVQAVSDSEYGLLFRYTATSDKLRTGYIILVCNQTNEGELTFLKEDPITFYYFKLNSMYACPRPSSNTPTEPPVVTRTYPVPPFKPTSDRPQPPTSRPTPVIFSMKAVVVLLLGILFLLTLVCGLLILALCVFSAKFQPKNTSVVENAREIKNKYCASDDMKKHLKEDFYNQNC